MHIPLSFKFSGVAAAIAIGLIGPQPAQGQKGIPPKEILNINVTTNYPQVLEFSPSMLSRLKAAPGWTVSIAASGLGKPRMLYPGKTGELYVTRRDAGEIILLRDSDGDLKFDEMMPVVAEFKGVHGITIHDGYLYGCSNRELKRFKLLDSGKVGAAELLIDDLPDGGQHGNRTMEFGPEGLLYLSVGSTCNDCFETNRENATMLVINPVDWKRKVFARGLRNTIGFDWNPGSRQLWGLDNGADAKGDELAPEELNLIEQDSDYGWPLLYGKNVIDNTREDPPGLTKMEFAKVAKQSKLDFPAHSAPIAFRFIDANTAIGCWHGSWNRKNPGGFKVQQILFDGEKPSAGPDFLTGFFDPADRTTFGRPAGIAVVAPDVVYISDDANGIIYCVKKIAKSN
jgi:glucose/arabinose dehydrogenase